MRFVDSKTFNQFRDKLDIRITIYFAILFGVLFSLIFLFGGEFLLFILLLVFFTSGLGGCIFGMRKLINYRTDKRKDNLEYEGKLLEVQFQNEPGVLIINNDKIVYRCLVAASSYKLVEFDVAENLLMIYGPIQYNRIQRLKYNDRELCHITLQEMPHGPLYQFLFFNIDESYKAVVKELESINKFIQEEDQKK